MRIAPAGGVRSPLHLLDRRGHDVGVIPGCNTHRGIGIAEALQRTRGLFSFCVLRADVVAPIDTRHLGLAVAQLRVVRRFLPKEPSNPRTESAPKRCPSVALFLRGAPRS